MTAKAIQFSDLIRCKNCFWWHRLEGHIGDCSNSHLNVSNLGEPAKDVMYTYDPSYGVETGEDFGCVHFRVKGVGE